MLTYTEAKQAIKASDKDTVAEVLKDYGEDVLRAALACDVALEDVAEAYQGQYSSDQEFAQSMADDLGLINKELSWPYTCIDWDFAAKELMYDYSEDNGYYFRNL